MAHKESHVQNFVAQNTTSEQSSFRELPPGPSSIEANPTTEPTLTHEKPSRLRSFAGKAAAGIALVNYFLYTGEQKASALTSEVLANQATSQETNTNIALGIAALSGIASFVAIARTKKEGRENRFNAALQAIVGESSGEQRVLKLAALNRYAKRKEYAPDVAEAAATYLRGRRSGLEILRKEHGYGTEEFERALTERRNADREAFKLLTKSLRLARKQLRISPPGRVKRMLRLDEQHELDKMTGTPIPKHAPRVEIKGINLDFMRDIKRYNLRDVDLTGAGMQRDQFTNVIFRNSCLTEAQFEDSRLFRCDLRGTDARAAYWYGATIESCVIDKHTKLGNLPDSYPDAKKGTGIDPDDPDGYRGMPHVVLKNLIPARTTTEEDLILQIHQWQKEGGLILLPGSNKEYFLPELQKSKPSQETKSPHQKFLDDLASSENYLQSI